MTQPGQPVTLNAKEHLPTKFGGGSRAQEYSVQENGNTYLVKLKGNPQGTRILFNDYVCGRIGEMLQLPISETALIIVPEPLLPNQNDVPGRIAGTQFATRTHADAQSDANALPTALNYAEFAGVVVFDTFILNSDSRQHLMCPRDGTRGAQRDHAVICDQGHAFGYNWTQQTLAGHAIQVEDKLTVKNHFATLATYEPFLARLENITTDQFSAIVHEAPLEEWQVTDAEADAMTDYLERRKTLVRPALALYLQ